MVEYDGVMTWTSNIALQQKTEPNNDIKRRETGLYWLIKYDEGEIFSIAGLASVSDISSVKNIAMHLLSCK